MDRFIIGGNSTGKTKKLLEYAKSVNAVVVCKNPNAMLSKAHAYGITGLHFIGYDMYMAGTPDYDEEIYVIDEICDLLEYWTHGNVCGFTQTIDEEIL